MNAIPLEPTKGRCLAYFSLFALTSPLFVLGCVPYPHEVVRTPEIRASFVRGIAPVGGAEVLIGRSPEYRDPCKGAHVVGMTDEKGQITVPARIETEIWYSLVHPPQTVGQVTNLCFRVPGQSTIFGAQFLHKLQDKPSFSVVCDPTPPRVHSLISKEQICR